NEPDTISSSLLSELIINLSKLLGSVYERLPLLMMYKTCKFNVNYIENLRRILNIKVIVA
ncbi:hypothetical protein, partial [Flavobacterium sp. Arc2]|uniref:hypothetical protein n=1 Tax=Flavobacterium sp. Arc2 TaxID=3046685 RepID=UPI00352C00F9